MQLKTSLESMRLVVAQLVLVAAGVGFIFYVTLPLPSSKLAGGFFFAIGSLNALFYKRTGQKFYAKSQSSWRQVAKFWARSGERGTQILFLGIGIILAVAGCALLLVGSA
jgi:hypothetical protein